MEQVSLIQETEWHSCFKVCNLAGHTGKREDLGPQKLGEKGLPQGKIKKF